jgi:dihydroorotate dehydrogenase (fumarate)
MNSNLDLQVWIRNVRFSSPIWNSSGIRSTTREQLQLIDASQAGAVLSKTCTFEAREASQSPTIDLMGDGNSLNCDRLANPGFRYYCEQSFSKPFIVSIQPSQDSNYENMLEACEKAHGVMMIELNLACPNLDVPMCYNFDKVRQILNITFWKARKKLIGVKVAPFLDGDQLRKIIKLFLGYPLAFITSCNTIPNSFSCSTVLGGLGGKALKYIALGQVAQISALVQKNIPVIGVGGIFDGQDVFDMISCGATAVQIGTCFLIEGTTCFERITDEFTSLMNSKGITSIANIPSMNPYNFVSHL